MASSHGCFLFAFTATANDCVDADMTFHHLRYRFIFQIQAEYNRTTVILGIIAVVNNSR